MITDEEILELENLLEQQRKADIKKGLIAADAKTNVNYRHLRDALVDEDVSGSILEGSSRSGKTYSGVDLIIYLCTEVEKQGCKINIYRETYESFKDSLYEDFKRRLPDFDLHNPFAYLKEVKSFKIGNSKISFIGCDKLGTKHGAGCDYAFFNEMMHIPQGVFDHVEMRCRKFWWGDYNPSFTQHWVFDKILHRPDVSFLRSTFKDNAHISKQELNKITSYEPWLPGSYEVVDNNIMYLGAVVDETNQPPPHPTNVENGTADEFMWKVYGLGLRGAMKGIIFPNVTLIDKFPTDIAPSYGVDFGFTCFSGDTMITTNEGQIPIKDIKTGQLVLTRKGFKKVIRLIDNGYKKTHTRKLGFDFGYTEISATLEHNFNVNKNEWRPFGELLGTETLCTLPYLMAENLSGIQQAKTGTTFSGNGKKGGYTFRKDYTERFINFTKAISQRAWTFTTSMKIRLTTALKILCSLLEGNTQESTTFYPNSTFLKKEKNTEISTGTPSETGQKEGRKWRKIYPNRYEVASIVRLNTHQPTHTKDSVQKNATIDGSMLPRKIRRQEFARIAERNLKGINISNQRPAELNARMSYQPLTELERKETKIERVYDIHVAECHEYFANGILVHNCDPSTIVRYGKRGMSIYLELLLYSPTETPQLLDTALKNAGVTKYDPITADSADRYVSDANGTFQMVRALFDMGWEISKVSKTKGITYWLLDMKRHKIHIVQNAYTKHFLKEKENYRWKEINGIQINQPIDGFDHAWSGGRYAHMADDFNTMSADIN